MQETLSQRFQAQLPEKPENHPEFVTELVDRILTQAQEINASDIHLLPTENRKRMDWRIDGVLHHVADFSHELAPRITSRLKVISHLLTYRTDVPQEGRIRQRFDITEGLENTPEAFLRLLTSQNTGKQLVKVTDEPS